MTVDWDFFAHIWRAVAIVGLYFVVMFSWTETGWSLRSKAVITVLSAVLMTLLWCLELPALAIFP